ncbi:MAG: ABC transporter substrate-binding protein, partial [Acidobacteriota bacterium]
GAAGVRAARLAAIGLALAGPLLGVGCQDHRAAGRRVVDGLGRAILLPESPRRIVSLAPSVTDALFALGFGDRVVGVTDFCRPPAAAGPIPRVGGMLNPSLETIQELEPDLLVATTSGNDAALAAQASALGLPLYTLHTPDIEAILRSLIDLAAALGRPERSEPVVSELRRRLAALRERLGGRPPVKVLYVVWGNPLVVPGGPAFVTDALRRAGAAPITGDAPAAWPAYTLEAVLADAPEAILTTARNRDLVERLARDPAWSGVPAVRRGRVHVVSGSIEQPGPRAIDGIEEVARVLHPDLFGRGRPAGHGED